MPSKAISCIVCNKTLKKRKRTQTLPGVHKAVFEKHAAIGIAGRKREYESKGSYSFSAYSDKTAIGTLVFPENLL